MASRSSAAATTDARSTALSPGLVNARPTARQASAGPPRAWPGLPPGPRRSKGRLRAALRPASWQPAGGDRLEGGGRDGDADHDLGSGRLLVGERSANRIGTGLAPDGAGLEGTSRDAR